MQVQTKPRVRLGHIKTSADIRQPTYPDRLLTTGQVATHTGMSESWLCKGRIYGWGPKFLRLGAGGKGGAIRYRWSDILTYLQDCECNPEGADHV